MFKAAVATAVGALALITLLVGYGAFAGFVVLAAAAAVVDLAVVLGRVGPRPVLPAAFLAGVGLPALAAVEAVGRPLAGWERIPIVVAIALLIGFILVLLVGRRGGAVAGLGSTVTIGLLVGLGASALLLLRGVGGGFRWVLALLLLVAAVEAARPLARLIQDARRVPEEDFEYDDVAPDEDAPLVVLAPAVVGVGLVGAAVYAMLDPPLAALPTLGLAVIALTASLGGSRLHEVLLAEAGLACGGGAASAGGAEATPPLAPPGAFLGAVDSLLLAAPAAYLLAEALAA
jgi:hypothetical protein